MKYTGTRIGLALALALLVSSSVSAQVIFDNGGLNPVGVSRSGVASPVGQFWSEVPFGSTSAGFTGSLSAPGPQFRLADNFTVNAGETWTISSIRGFAYATGTATTALFSTGTIQVWLGRPGDVGSTVIFGDTTTDRVTGSAFTDVFRIFATTVPAGGTASAPGTTRAIKTIDYDTTGLVISTPGDYWIDIQVDHPTTPGGAVFFPSVTPTDGSRAPVGANGRQLQAAPTGWADMIDTGNPGTEPDIQQALPFQVFGSITSVPEPTTIALFGLIGAGASGGWYWRRQKTLVSGKRK